MKLSKNVKPISYLKTHASEVIHEIAEKQETYVITLNGEAKVVVQDIREYENMQESLALLKSLAMSSKSRSDGKITPARKVFADLQQEMRKSEAK